MPKRLTPLQRATRKQLAYNMKRLIYLKKNCH